MARSRWCNDGRDVLYFPGIVAWCAWIKHKMAFLCGSCFFFFWIRNVLTIIQVFSESAFTWLYNIVHLNCSALLPKVCFYCYFFSKQSFKPSRLTTFICNTSNEFNPLKHESNLEISYLILIDNQQVRLLSWEYLFFFFHTFNAFFFPVELGLPASDDDAMAGDQLSRSAGSGLFAFHSIINHSCSPNAQVSFPRSDALLEIVATSAIEPNEELTIDYLGVTGMPNKTDRLAHLKYELNFFCDFFFLFLPPFQTHVWMDL